MKQTTKLEKIKNKDDYLEVKTNGAQFQIYVLDENIIRFRSTFANEFPPEESYALVKTAWNDQTDDVLADERQRVEPLPRAISSMEGGYRVEAGNYIIVIHADPFSFEIEDRNGNVIRQDLPGRAFVRDNNGRTIHYSRMQDGHRFYGFGEKSGVLDKYKRRMRMHNTDSLGWNAKKTDPLYKMIPFYIDFDSNNNIASGMFYNNAADSVFDMDCEHSNYWLRYSYFQCDAGDIDAFFIGGPTIKDVVRHYTDLTGKTVMMPKASLGYMGSTMYYTELDRRSDQAILDFVDECRHNGIPCDGFFLSSGYTARDDGKRYVFNWDKKRFPDPQKFIDELKKRGVLLAPNVKPGMLTTHPLTRQFSTADAYVKNASGDGDQEDRYWGGAAHFVDFTSAGGRDQWMSAMNEALLKFGVTSIWNDNNEYEINDNSAMVSADGLQRPIGELKPVEPTMMAKTAHLALERYSPGTRPYVINRAGFAGIQRYAQTWAGDNYTSWTSLKYNIPTILGMGLSGVANNGCDIGGFDGPLPEPELFVRWVQNGIFQPRFSIHSCNNDNTVTEPWTYPKYLPYIRTAIQLRYRLVPYMYSLLAEAARTGDPIMRPLVYEFQDDPQVAQESFEFMLGPALLVANVVDKDQTHKDVYLPAGTNWIDLTTNKRYSGGQTITVPVDLSSIPLFLRCGAVLPQCPGLMNLHRDKQDHLRILIEPSESTEFTLYEDDGTTLDYRDGKFLRTTIRVKASDEGINIGFTTNGDYQTQVKNVELAVYCPGKAPLSVTCAGNALPQFLNKQKFDQSDRGWIFDGDLRRVIIKYPNPAGNYTLELNTQVKDLISI